uniref:Pro/VPg n=1 Tax=Maize yellow mosaic virus TaxID=1856642 RepID=A0A8A6RHX8_9VIRU|nr:Pro/VPg [Maize yellow mosaic virus]
MQKLFSAAFFLCCLLCYATCPTRGDFLEMYGLPLRGTQFGLEETSLLPRNASLPFRFLLAPDTCIEISYSALSREIARLALQDLHSISSAGSRALSSSWKGFAEEWNTSVVKLAHATSGFYQQASDYVVSCVLELLGSCLVAIIYTWSFFISSLFWVVTFMLQHYTPHVLSIAVLYICTTLLVRLATKIFGGWPVMMISWIGTSTLGFFKTLLSKENSISYEIPTPGYKSIEIPQKPPKDCVLLVQHNDALNSPGGYASCVRLLNGSNALLTAEHVAAQKGELLVASTRTGNKIKLSLFNRILTTTNSDVSLFQGPPGWESLLGCKAADITPVDGLTTCEASLFRFDGHWMRSNASLVGTEETYVSVLSNTEEGYSGTPYFNGKSILGVHVGGNATQTNNLMAPIPSIPGLTKHRYVFESPQLKGRLFTEQEVEQLEVDIDEAFKKAYDLVHFKSKTGRNWADYEDDISYEAPKFQGNDARGSVRENKTDLPTPTVSPVATSNSDILNKVVEALVNKIDVSVIERMVVQQIAESAMKRPKNNRRRQSKPKTSPPTSPPFTGGKYVTPALRSQGSKPVGPSQGTTSQNRKKNQNGGGYLQRETRRWQKKSAVSGGPSSVPQLN